MTAIPDRISADQLKEILEEVQEEAKESKSPKNKMSKDEMQSLVIEDIEKLTDKFDSVFGYKLVAHYALYCLMQHHNEAHDDLCKEGEFEAALLWGRDAGWIQLMLKGLNDIGCGPEDYIAPQQ